MADVTLQSRYFAEVYFIKLGNLQQTSLQLELKYIVRDLST
jgi:hypothetical protein